MHKIIFPDPEFADTDGLLAIGGNLEPDTLISAYSSGIFPWTVRPITWWSPDPRAVFDIENFKLTRRMERLFRQQKFTYSFDKCFAQVMKNCALPGPGREETWISREFIEAYTRMHELGFAHSAEAWLNGELVGGIYGVCFGGFFAGESMFHKVANASTLCLRFLIRHLKERGYILFDSQVASPHTRSLGVKEICRREYLETLRIALNKNCIFF